MLPRITCNIHKCISENWVHNFFLTRLHSMLVLNKKNCLETVPSWRQVASEYFIIFFPHFPNRKRSSISPTNIYLALRKIHLHYKHFSICWPHFRCHFVKNILKHRKKDLGKGLSAPTTRYIRCFEKFRMCSMRSLWPAGPCFWAKITDILCCYQSSSTCQTKTFSFDSL